MLSNTLQCTEQSPTINNYLAQNIYSAKIENPAIQQGFLGTQSE